MEAVVFCWVARVWDFDYAGACVCCRRDCADYCVAGEFVWKQRSYSGHYANAAHDAVPALLVDVLVVCELKEL